MHGSLVLFIFRQLYIAMSCFGYAFMLNRAKIVSKIVKIDVVCCWSKVHL